ncbi:hypothetical protein U9R62_08935 [Cylindrospermopsis raciborskii DSH]
MSPGKGTDTIEKASRLFNQEAKQLEQLGQHPQIPELLDYTRRIIVTSS